MRTSPGRYLFPPITPLPATLTEQVARIRGELSEVEQILYYEEPGCALEEAVDVLHAAETLVRLIAQRHRCDVGAVQEQVKMKNRTRGYYGADT